MGSLDTRLKLLEDGGKPCPECGLGGGGKEKMEVSWPDVDGNDEEEVAEEDEEEEWCPECGRQLVYVVRWLDLEELDPEEGE